MEKNFLRRCCPLEDSSLWNLTRMENTVSPRKGVGIGAQESFGRKIPVGALNEKRRNKCSYIYLLIN